MFLLLVMMYTSCWKRSGVTLPAFYLSSDSVVLERRTVIAAWDVFTRKCVYSPVYSVVVSPWMRRKDACAILRLTHCVYFLERKEPVCTSSRMFAHLITYANMFTEEQICLGINDGNTGLLLSERYGVEQQC